MTSPETPPPVAVIGAGLDLGAGRRGVDMGPSAIRYAELEDADPRARPRTSSTGATSTSPVPEATEDGDPHARYLGPILQVCEQARSARRRGGRQGYLPLVLGGDHSIAMGTLGGMAAAQRPGRGALDRRARRPQPPDTSPSGNVHGMPLAAALGAAGDAFPRTSFPAPSIERAALVGVRSLDPGERH